MSKVDWSKAPEWATCVVKCPGLKEDYYWSEDPKDDAQLLHLETGCMFTMSSSESWVVVTKRPIGHAPLLPGKVIMTEKAETYTYEQFLTQGWTYDQLVENGYVTRINDDHLTDDLRKLEPAPDCRCTFTPVKQPSTAPDLLNQAAALLAERGKQYDTSGQERSAAKIVAAFNAITGRDLTPGEGWLFLMMLKAVRFYSNTETSHRDSLEDLIAYVALHAEEYLNDKQ